MRYKKYEYYEFIDTAIKQRLLEFFRKDPKGCFSTKDISDKLKIPQASVSRALTDLEKLGILHSREEGKFKYFSLDKDVSEKISKIFSNLEQVRRFTLEKRRKNGVTSDEK